VKRGEEGAIDAALDQWRASREELASQQAALAILCAAPSSPNLNSELVP
jgi:hypothetical protein